MVEWSTHLAQILASTNGPGSHPGSATQMFHECTSFLSCHIFLCHQNDIASWNVDPESVDKNKDVKIYILQGTYGILKRNFE